MKIAKQGRKLNKEQLRALDERIESVANAMFDSFLELRNSKDGIRKIKEKIERDEMERDQNKVQLFDKYQRNKDNQFIVSNLSGFRESSDIEAIT